MASASKEALVGLCQIGRAIRGHCTASRPGNRRQFGGYAGNGGYSARPGLILTMDRALFILMMLQARAVVRRTLRGARTIRGAAFLAVGVVVFILWLGPTLMGMSYSRRDTVAPEKVREYIPAALLLACAASLMGTGDKALYFTPAEVNFLFPGPFSRRQLLGYKLTKAAIGALGMGLFMSIALRRFSQLWLGALLGAFLSLLLIHLFTTCVVIIGQTVTAAAYNRGRRVVLAVVIAAALLGLGPALAAGAVGDPATLFHRFTTSIPGRLLLAPFQPFGRTFTASSFPQLLTGAATAAAVNLVLLALTIWLDANYLEAAAGASQRVYERVQRMRRGVPGAAFSGGGRAGAIDAGGSAKTTGARFFRELRVPRAPWLGGAGPVAWRQLTTAARRSGGLLFVLALSGGVFVTFFVFGHRGADIKGAVFPAAAWFTIMLVANLKFDFRADLDQMPWLKSLPLRPWAVAAGQLAIPVLLLAGCHLAMFALAAALLPALRRPLLAAAVLVLPFDLLLLGVENLLFLLFPTRGAAAPGELGAVGRQVVMFLVKIVTIAFAAGLAVGVGLAAAALTHSATAGVAAAFATLAAEGIALVPLVALAYARFDPSVDTPP
jgi:hypothetical protein